MPFQSFKKVFGDNWGAASRKASQRAVRRPSRFRRPVQLEVEALEARTLLAVPPPIIVNGDMDQFSTFQRDLTPFLGSGNDRQQVASPALAVDPTNPNKLVAVWVRHDPNVPGNQKYFMEGAYSVDGGSTWNVGTLFFPGNDPDPSIGPPLQPFEKISTPSLTIGRNSDVYVTYIQHNPNQDLSGKIMFRKFDFSGNFPSVAPISIPAGKSNNDGTMRVIFSWFNPDPNAVISGYDSVVVANTSVPLYTDPTTGEVQRDTSAGTVYLAWGTFSGTPTGLGGVNNNNFNSYKVRVTGTPDGGNTFMPAVFLNTVGGGVAENFFSTFFQASPRMAVSQGTADGRIGGGELNVVWDRFGRNFQPNRGDDIMSNRAPGGTGGEFSRNTPQPIINALQDPVTQVNIPQTTLSTLAVNITDPNFTTVSDITLNVTLTVPNSLDGFSMALIAPNGRRLVLFSNRTQPNGMATVPAPFQVGVTGTAMGVNLTTGIDLGTTFEDISPYYINSGNAQAPYTGSYRPENFPWNTNGGNSALPITNNTFAAQFGGLNLAAVNGTWTLEIVCNVQQMGGAGAPPLELRHWGISITSALKFDPTVVVAFGGQGPTASNRMLSPSHGNYQAPYTNTPSFSPDLGVGPHPVIAQNNTLGSFDPYQGRLYVAFTSGISNDTDIRLAASDDAGRTWNVFFDPFWGTNSIRLNDDIPQDNFSEGDRGQFLPEIAVDTYTGTLAVSFYDARNDPSNNRVATYVAMSIDGGQTFAPQTFVNARQEATDVITGDTSVLGPVPDNLSSGNAGRDTTMGFGNQQGLAIVNGHVYNLWAGNQDWNNLVYGPAGVAASHIMASFASTAFSTAPNAIIPEDFKTNTTKSTLTIAGSDINITGGGLTAFTGLRVRLNVTDSRTSQLLITLTSPPTPFSPNGITVTLADHRGGSTGQAFTNTVFNDLAALPISAGAPPFTGTFRPDGLLASFIFGGLTSPNGTWTLTVTADPNTNNTGKILDWGLEFVQGGALYEHGPRILHDKSTLGGPVGAGAPPTETDLNGNVLTYNNVKAADGTTQANGFVVNFDRPMDPNTFTIANVQVMYRDVKTPASQPGTLLQVLSITPVFDPNALVYDPTDFTKTNAQKQRDFGPSRYLILFKPPTGPSNGVGTYSYTILPVPPGGAPSQGIRDRLRNPLNNGVLGQFMNPLKPFSNPASVDGVPFQLPYAEDTLPLIVPGPFVITSFVSGVVKTPDNLVQNNLVSSIDVVFDRNMNPATFEADGRDILRIFGPAGVITGPFTVTPDPTNASNPNGSDPDPAHPRTFKVNFTPQQLSGTYTVTFGPNIQAANGLNGGDLVDTNLNAGLYVLRGVDPTSSAITTVRSDWIKLPQNQIAPGTALVTTIDVTDSFAIQHTKVQLNITYPNDPDLEGTLIAPDGTAILLFSRVGSSGTRANFTNTFFDDNAVTSIVNGIAPFNGVFNAQQPLDTALNGKNSAGRWTLVIVNHSSSNSGTLDGWSLFFDQTQLGTGLGEPVADQFTASFRVFTTNPNNPLSQNQMTAVGPAGTINAPTTATATKLAAGTVNDITADPSDPSGNTVYVGAAAGGVWKSTNFLNPTGQPTYYPLTDFGPSGGLYIGGIAVFARNNDPRQSIVFAATGNGDAFTAGGPNATGATGVGVIRSMDGGASWSLLDSTTNVDANGNLLPMNSPLRDHRFVGLSSFRIVVDPTPSPSGGVLVYMAVSDPNAVNGGIWFSNDGGNHWFLSRAGQATDVLLANNTIDPLSGNRNRLFAAFTGDGVYQNTSQGQGAWVLLQGNAGNALYQDILTLPPSPIAVGNSPDTPNTNKPGATSAKGRIVLAVPAQGSTPVERLLYAGWLYAAVLNPNGTFNGLFMTKDFGANWTRVPLQFDVSQFFDFNPGSWGPVTPADNFPAFQYPSNDNTDPSFDPTSGNLQSGFAISLAVDPLNANVVYLGGSRTDFLKTSGLLRIDTTTIQDPYSLVGFDYNLNDGGVLLPNTGGVVIAGAVGSTGGRFGYPYGVVPTDNATGQFVFPLDPTHFLNVLKNPYNVFSNATFFTINVVSFRNTGLGASWSYWDSIYRPGNENVNAVFDPQTSFPWRPALSLPPNVDYISPTQGTTNIHRLVTMVDPVTGKSRLIIAADNGVFTAVDDGTGQISRATGTAGSPGTIEAGALPTLDTFSRNGNLQIAEFFYGAAQPSNVAAQAAQALFYGASRDVGVPASDPNALTNGNLRWSGVNAYTQSSAQSVATDQSGSGTFYSTWWEAFGVPASSSPPPDVALTDFIQQHTPNNNRFLTNSRTQGLFVNSGFPPTAEWPLLGGSNIAVNPISSEKNSQGQFANSQRMVIGSQTGNIYRTANSGLQWDFIGNPLGNNSYAQALAYGSRDPANPFGRIDDFIYAGTVSGRLFVTLNGGGSWTEITTATDGSQLRGSSVEQIVVNPMPGSHEIYVVTSGGVFHLADTRTPSHWDDVTGNLFGIQADVFGDPTQARQLLAGGGINSLQADWRFAIPDDPANPIGPKHPVLYVGGEGGVFVSVDRGVSWNRFPGDGGHLPVGNVTSLSIVLGNIDPTTGKAIPDPANPGGYLLAAIYGRGDFAIRLVNPTLPRITSIATSSTSTPITGVIVTFNEPVDPNTFSLSDINSFTGPNGSLMSSLVQQNPRPVDTTLLRYEIAFAPQRAVGTYTVNLGPGVSDFAGFLMDQNGNGIAGEVPGDSFTGQFTIVFVSGPVVTGQTAATDGSSFTVTFNKAVAASSLTPSQVVVTSGGSPVTPLSITPVNTTTFTVALPPLTSGSASYQVTLGPNITDTAGNAMNQNQNQINGEVPGDRFTFNITVFVSGPIVSSSAAAPDGAASSFTVTFNKPVAPGTFNAANLAISGPNGPVPASSIRIAQLSATQFEVGLPSIGQGQSYFVAVGPLVTDTSGNAMNQNQNQVNGEFPGDRFNFQMTNTGGVVPPPPPPTEFDALIVTGADAGGGPNVILFDRTNGNILANFMAYDPFFTGGVRVAMGDVNNDGTPDVITAPGPGGGPDIKVFDGKSLTPGGTPQLLSRFFAFNPLFTGGSNLAVGDVNDDGFADIIIGADKGGGPNVSVFSGNGFGRLSSFFAYNPNFTGGVRVAAGDTNGVGGDEIITGAGAGGGPNVSVFTGNGFLLQTFFAYNPLFTAGVYVGAADVLGRGYAQIITGAGAGGGPNVTVFDPMNNNAVVSSFFAYNPLFTGGVRVAAYPTVTIPGGATSAGAIVTVAGPGGGADVAAFSPLDGSRIDNFFAYNPLFSAGLWVGAGRLE